MSTVTELLREEETHERQDLVRGLKDRHVQLIALERRPSALNRWGFP